MIKVFLERHDGEDLFCHRFVCDYCGDVIEDLDLALFLGPNLSRRAEMKEGDSSEVLVLHKGKCVQSVEAATRGGRCAWEESERAISQLLFNGGKTSPTFTLKGGF